MWDGDRALQSGGADGSVNHRRRLGDSRASVGSSDWRNAFYTLYMRMCDTLTLPCTSSHVETGDGPLKRWSKPGPVCHIERGQIRAFTAS